MPSAITAQPYNTKKISTIVAIRVAIKETGASRCAISYAEPQVDGMPPNSRRGWRQGWQSFFLQAQNWHLFAQVARARTIAIPDFSSANPQS